MVNYEQFGFTVVPACTPDYTQKLTEAQAKAIKHSRDHPDMLAERYGISRRTVYDVQHGVSWKHI